MNAKNIITVACIGLFLMGNTVASFGQATKKKSPLKKSQKGAIIGAGSGAVIGGIIGKNKSNTAIGAIIGATVGGAAGAVIGDIMDKKAEKLREDLGDKAKVERVGEGVKLTMGNSLLFDFGSSVLLPKTMMNLKNMAETLKKDAQIELLIEGNTDSIGSLAYNKRLSEMRANSVGNFLIAEGIAPNRIKIVGMGEANPVASNNSEAGRQQNRRVEMGIYASEQMKKEAGSPVSLK
ncbi:Peptidoglycan-associated lipoprotein [Emticicia aquatica]|jgi:outer membrane protein OmpA-like peptidoglycan-associated protein|uniref:Peptidoglycan-associated lipoprotein n=1 Tax=Emticicia aquatica TaxID=1681835 RepID=A0ABN8ESU9_9BACT|nr:OmpA family protein [Emticicia aquatica]CAH0996057.1 Peptidoglycan-associated lipoprotein [Emticicia aquatica]